MKRPWLLPDDPLLLALDTMEPPRTRKFMEWFGDSRVVRSTSSVTDVAHTRPKDPLIAYHGTRAPEEFSAFHPARRVAFDKRGHADVRSNDPNTFLGPHFTDDVNVAIGFMTGRHAWIHTTPRDKPRTYPVYLKIENPAMYESEAQLHYDIAGYALEAGYRLPKDFVDDFLIDQLTSGEPLMMQYGVPVRFDVASMSDFQRLMREDQEFALRVFEFSLDTFMESGSVARMMKMVAAAKRHFIELGHDGIWYTNDGEGGNGWIPFHPSQIKSAIANDGTYGPSKDIRRNPWPA